MPPSATITTWAEAQDVPDIVKFLEARGRREQRDAHLRLANRFPLPQWMQSLIVTGCLGLPSIYIDRHRQLALVISAENDFYDDANARIRVSSAWEAYCQGMVDEWSSSNLITALILGAAGSFLALPDINNVSRYALLFALLSSLASIGHATAFAHIYRSKLDNKHFNIIQLTTYMAYYCFIDNIMLSLPLLAMFYAIGAFSVSILAYLWPVATSAVDLGPWTLSLTARILLPAIFVMQLAFIGLSYYSSKELTFTTDELMTASKQRELAREMRREKEAFDRQAGMLMNMPIVNGPNFKPPPTALSGKPMRWVRVRSWPWGIPEEAIALGYENNRPVAYMWEHYQLFVARIFYEGRWRVGKCGWHLSANVYIPYEHLEIAQDPALCDVLAGGHSDFAWYEVKEGEAFNIAKARQELPENYEFLLANSSHDTGPATYIAAATMPEGGRHPGTVLDGETHASIPWRANSEQMTPFLVLLVKKGALESHDVVEAGDYGKVFEELVVLGALADADDLEKNLDSKGW